MHRMEGDRDKALDKLKVYKAKMEKEKKRMGNLSRRMMALVQRERVWRSLVACVLDLTMIVMCTPHRSLIKAARS